MPPRLWIAAAAALTVAFSAFMLRAGIGGDAGAPCAAAAAPASEIDALRDALAAESATHAELAERLDHLALEAADLRALLAAGSDDPGAAVAARDEEDARDDVPVSPHDYTQPGPLDPARVAAAGFSIGAVEAIQERIDRAELDQLYLRDRASREGWLGTPRYREERRALGLVYDEIRSELDEGGYDRFLYAVGRSNRVVIDEVMSGSAAEAAGLRSGDLLLRYDDRALFSPVELRRATLEGDAGASVALDLERDGDLMRVYVPRGPVGVRVRPGSRPPKGTSAQ